MKKQLTLATLIACTTSAPLSLSAEGFYVGFAAGSSDFDFRNMGCCDTSAPDDTAYDKGSYAIRGGYKFNRYLAVEIAYNDFGTAEESRYNRSTNHNDSRSTSVKNKSIGSAAVGFFPLSDNVSVHGKIGVERWESDGKYTRSFNQTTPPLVSNYRFPIEFQGNDVYLGVGASYSFSDAFSVNLDYEYHSWDEKRMELKNNNLSLSVYYYFK